jgi:hypothetical protein
MDKTRLPAEPNAPPSARDGWGLVDFLLDILAVKAPADLSLVRDVEIESWDMNESLTAADIAWGREIVDHIDKAFERAETDKRYISGVEPRSL